MDEYVSGTESEQSTKESSQDEFGHRLRQQKEKQAEICVLLKTSFEPYADEPLADEEWLLVYINEQH